ncbi:MAG TPA: tetratricopeptide repeat protein [Blastocatellia bacterium]|nr:tetratricopeptide repeat protein [Blastocatellia bacterium]
MSRNRVIVGAIGLAFGFMVSFFWTRNYNKSPGIPQTKAAGTMPAADSGAAGQPGQQAAMGSVQQTIDNAKKNPNDFEAQIKAASMYDQIGRAKETVEFLEKAYSIDPAQAAKMDVPAYIAQYYSSQQNFDQAETWFRRELEVKPDNPDVQIELGATFLERQPPNIDKAMEYLQAVLKSNPDNAHAMVHLTEAYALKKDAASAEKTLNHLKQVEASNQMIPKLQSMVDSLKSGAPVSIPKD